MLPPSMVVLGFLTGLAWLLTRGRRQLRGSARRRQLQMAALLLVFVGGFGAWGVPRYGPDADGPWEVGDLRPDGLRLVPSGRDDATDVLDPASFEHPFSRELYGIATEIPEILNRLYCWCGCIEQGRHRSALACYEDRSAVGCGVCQETARIAWRQVTDGVRDPTRIQRAIDLEWAPSGARQKTAAGPDGGTRPSREQG